MLAAFPIAAANASTSLPGTRKPSRPSEMIDRGPYGTSYETGMVPRLIASSRTSPKPSYLLDSTVKPPSLNLSSASCWWSSNSTTSLSPLSLTYLLTLAKLSLVWGPPITIRRSACLRPCAIANALTVSNSCFSGACRVTTTPVRGARPSSDSELDGGKLTFGIAATRQLGSKRSRNFTSCRLDSVTIASKFPNARKTSR